MKKRMITLLLVIAVFTGMIIPSEKVEAAGLKISNKKITLTVSKSKQLSLKKGSRKITKGVKWKSSKKAVATVSRKGKVSAKKAGKTTITATYKGKKYVCKVTVKGKDKKLSKKQILNLYSSYIDDHFSNEKPSIRDYKFVYVDNDSIPELVMGYNPGSSLVLTIYNGKVYVICHSSHLRFTYVEKKGYFSTGGMNGSDEFYCRLSKGNTKNLASRTMSIAKNYNLEYKIGDSEVTEGKYNKYIKSLGNFKNAYEDTSSNMQDALDKLNY